MFDRRPRHEPLFDIDPATGATIEVFYADRGLETFGRVGAGWFWCPRRRGFAPTGPAHGPFPTSYSAYRDAWERRTGPHNSGKGSSRCGLRADSAVACMRQGAAEQIASAAARAAARAATKPLQKHRINQILASPHGGEGGIRTPDRLAPMPHFECGAFNHSATSPGARPDAPVVGAV